MRTSFLQNPKPGKLLWNAPHIVEVSPNNNFVGTCLENKIYSRMEEIYFSDLAPETADINLA